LIPGGVSITPKFWAKILLKNALFFILIRTSGQLSLALRDKISKIEKTHIFQ